MIVIVGHGPSLQGSRLGEYIDSFKYVIRFPYLYNWQVPRDYGVRTSYVCSPSGGKFTRIRNEKPEIGYYLWDRFHTISPAKCKIFGIEKYEDVSGLVQKWARKLPRATPNLSTGTVGILIAASRLGEPIIALGCDHLSTGKDMGENYIGSWVYEDRPWTGKNIISKCTHSLKHDRKLIDEMAEQYNVSISFK